MTIDQPPQDCLGRVVLSEVDSLGGRSEGLPRASNDAHVNLRAVRPAFNYIRVRWQTIDVVTMLATGDAGDEDESYARDKFAVSPYRL